MWFFFPPSGVNKIQGTSVGNSNKNQRMWVCTVEVFRRTRFTLYVWKIQLALAGSLLHFGDSSDLFCKNFHSKPFDNLLYYTNMWVPFSFGLNWMNVIQLKTNLCHWYIQGQKTECPRGVFVIWEHSFHRGCYRSLRLLFTFPFCASVRGSMQPLHIHLL